MAELAEQVVALERARCCLLETASLRGLPVTLLLARVRERMGS